MSTLEQNLKRIVDLGIESLFMKIIRGLDYYTGLVYETFLEIGRASCRER